MLPMRRRLVGSLFALLTASTAQAFDLPAVNLGFTSFLDGGPPSGPGWYFQEYLHYYDGDKLVGDDGNAALAPTPRGFEEHSADAFVAMQQLVYQSDTPLLMGGKWGLNFMLPIVNLDVSPDDSLAIQANDTGFGDLLVGPYLQWDPIMGPNGPKFMHRIEFQMILPTGKYDADHELNPGSNHFSFNPYWSGTLFMTPRWTASWRLHYLWNGKNDDPSNRTRFAIQLARPDLPVDDIRPGQAVHVNFATAYEVIPKQLRIGINGYYLNQITDTEIDGEDFDGRKEEVFAIGPGLAWHVSPETHVMANLYFETDAKNRPEGTRFNLRLVQHF
jgi:hypothetical protein